ncbi:pyruvate dehydrogenase (acetyl-transferring) E1 component subunit alpha [Caldinitratiruptor microaerophilus]|uniref:pyruvate dehydrogenase (acetyl-transferring) E1 component subunit alpha n=1 Tax=Caldinitratiruptor microaerophilus TaxID=671077 RepID=UPI00223118F1|nr:pyruvate dehydrogenase (acetyl-transferring) E1 component subunit alpha [Caldinitratiruptor microaerophilus]
MPDLFLTPRQVLAPDGTVVGPVPDLPPDRLVGFLRWMYLGRYFSDRMVNLQRQGRMGTFGPIAGQEAASVGLAAPLEGRDWLVGSYRELLSYFVKGVPMLALMQVYRGYVGDQYPPEARCLPIQIVIGAHITHAVGIAMAARIAGDDAVALAAFGDGASSEGDVHEAMNFAGVYKAPVVFVLQNNHWAISTHRSRQSAAATLAQRAAGYGFPGVVVDGNDVLATYAVVKEAVDRARAGDGPTLIEAITYRYGAHTTADDPTRYRPDEELKEWQARDPITRYRRFLLDRGLLDEAADRQLQEQVAAEVDAAVEQLEAMSPTPPERIFDIVYAEPTPQLRAQRAEMAARTGGGRRG